MYRTSRIFNLNCVLYENHNNNYNNTNNKTINNNYQNNNVIIMITKILYIKI